MMRRKILFPRGRGEKTHLSGQSMLEYSIVVGVIATILFAMSALIKRGAQGMIMVVADQIGNQAASDQNFNKTSSHLEYSFTAVRMETDKILEEKDAKVNYIYNDVGTSRSEESINLGFTEEQ